MIAIPDINNPEQRVFIEFDEIKQEVRVFNLIVDVLIITNWLLKLKSHMKLI